MKDFALCIESSLLSRDCVVVPGVGAFIAQLMPARLSAEENLLLPPYRTVRFNCGITHDDSTLVADIARVYNIGIEKAAQKLAEWTLLFQQTLEDCGTLDFGSIGVFTTEENGDIVFTPSESGVCTPRYFGLDACHIDPFIQPTVLSSVPEQAAITIRISRRLARYAAAACIAVLLFCSYGAPVSNTESISFGTEAELFLPIHLMERSVHHLTPIVTPVVQTEASEATVVLQKETMTEETEKEGVDKETYSPACYCIVVASAVGSKNAQAYAEKLTKRGFHDVRVMESKIRRVVVGHYATEAEAHAAATELHQQGEEFANAWVLKL